MSGAFLPLVSALAFVSPAAMEGMVAAGVVKHVLANGVRVVVLHDRSAPVVAARALWSGGVRREPVDLPGISRVLAAAWTGGCGHLDAGAIERELRADSASMVGLAGRETVALAAEWTRAGWEHGFDLLADCIVSPAFPPEAIAAARQHTRELAERRGRSAPWVAAFLLEQALYGTGHPDAPAPLGPAASLDHIERIQIRDHYRVHYPVSAMTLAVVGDVDPERVVARAQARFGSAPRRLPPDAPAAHPAAVSSPRERELYRHLTGGRNRMATIAIGFHAVGRAHRDRPALEVAAALLDEAAHAALVSDGEAGYLALFRTCRPEDLATAHDSMRLALDRLRSPAEEEVRRAAARLARSRQDALDRAPSAAALLALYEAVGAGAEHAARQPALLRSVRAADVRAAAGRYLRADLSAVATATPLLASPEVVRRMLAVPKSARKTERKAARAPSRGIERRPARTRGGPR